MIISKAKNWGIRVYDRKITGFFYLCSLCRKRAKRVTVISSNTVGVTICTRCMKQINRATSKYFRGKKDANNR